MMECKQARRKHGAYWGGAHITFYFITVPFVSVDFFFLGLARTYCRVHDLQFVAWKRVMALSAFLKRGKMTVSVFVVQLVFYGIHAATSTAPLPVAVNCGGKQAVEGGEKGMDGIWAAWVRTLLRKSISTKGQQQNLQMEILLFIPCLILQALACYITC